MPETFAGRIGRTYLESEEHWPEPFSAPAGTPNVVYVVWDDVGFSDFGAYGSEIETRATDRIAAQGVQMTNFHTPPLCSPTRASLLTGRNHHSVGMRMLSNFDSGFPSGRGRITHEAATVAEMLKDAGFNTMAAGKWHLAPLECTTPSGPYDQWPLSRGFERYYGFLEAETDNFFPELVRDNHAVEPPATPEEGYHLSADIIDNAIDFVRDQVSFTPEKPFFLYVALSAAHAPHQAPQEYLDKYRGKFDEGWDVLRERRHQRQIELGLLPPGTALPPGNPGVQAWADLSDDERRLFARMQEAYAAMIDHADAQLERLLDFLESVDQFDNTVFVMMSDNGASPEGTAIGTVYPTAFQNRVPENLADNLALIDQIGGPFAQSNYPWGWAQVSNTPFRLYKQYTHEGGVRVPCVISWRNGGLTEGRVSHHFQHTIDVTPTILDIVGVTAPTELHGIPQMPLHGKSFLPALRDPAAGPSRDTQYFEMFGHRGIVHGEWKAVAAHVRGSSWEEDKWELFRIHDDPTEAHDLSEQHPEVLQELIELFWTEAAKYDVLPLDDRGFAIRARVPRPGSVRDRRRFHYLPGVPGISGAAIPPTMNRSHEIEVRLDRRQPVDGTVVTVGNVGGGYVMHVRDGRLWYEYNFLGRVTGVSTPEPLPQNAEVVVRFEFRKTEDCQGTGVLFVDDVEVSRVEFTETFPYFLGFAGMEIGKCLHSPVSPRVLRPGRLGDNLLGVTYHVAASEDLDAQVHDTSEPDAPTVAVGFEVVD